VGFGDKVVDRKLFGYKRMKLILNSLIICISKFRNSFPSLTVTTYMCVFVSVYECDFYVLIVIYIYRCFLCLDSVRCL